LIDNSLNWQLIFCYVIRE